MPDRNYDDQTNSLERLARDLDQSVVRCFIRQEMWQFLLDMGQGDHRRSPRSCLGMRLRSRRRRDDSLRYRSLRLWLNGTRECLIGVYG